jgi:hypothetical protein
MKWGTHERSKVERIAGTWLIAKFAVQPRGVGASK